MGNLSAEGRCSYFNSKYSSGRFAVRMENGMVEWAELTGLARDVEGTARAEFTNENGVHLVPIAEAWSEATAPPDWKAMADDPER